jgi:hypothetical protein
MLSLGDLDSFPLQHTRYHLMREAFFWQSTNLAHVDCAIRDDQGEPATY